MTNINKKKKKKKSVSSAMDANGKPIKATTVSVGYYGKRKNIVQKPANSNHVPTPVFVREVYVKRKPT